MLVMSVFITGCDKQGKQGAMKKGTEMPAIGKKSAVDTSDIFKEFYSDDTAGQGKSKKSSKGASANGQTFSPSSSASSGEFSENGRYVVQVSCVPAKSLAEKIAAGLKEKNFPAYTAAVQNPTPQLSGTYYRVRIGGFKGLSAAKSFGENSLVVAGYQYWVDKKSNDNVGMEGYGLGGAASAGNPTSSYENASPAGSSSWSSAPAPSAASTPTPAPETQNSTPHPAAATAATPAPSAEPAKAAEPTKNETAKAAPAASSTPSPATTPAASAATRKPSNPASSEAGKSPAGSSEWGSDSSSSSGGW